LVYLYPIHVDQGSPIFLGEDRISYCTTVRVRGVDILRNVIFSEYTTIYQINRFLENSLYYIFIVGKMYFAAG